MLTRGPEQLPGRRGGPLTAVRVTRRCCLTPPRGCWPAKGGLVGEGEVAIALIGQSPGK